MSVVPSLSSPTSSLGLGRPTVSSPSGTIDGWQVPLAPSGPPLPATPVSFSDAAVTPPTASGRQLIQSDIPGRFQLWSYRCLSKKSLVHLDPPYARPVSLSAWRYAQDKARHHSSRFDKRASVSFAAILTGEVGALASSLLTNGALVALSFVVLTLVAAVLGWWSMRARDSFEDILRQLTRADSRDSAKLVAAEVVISPKVSSRWEGILRHAEETGVPILEADIENILQQSDENRPPADDSVASWRVAPAE